jgi:hypothetical protein
MAAIALKQLQDLAVCGREYGRFGGRHDVDGVVYPAFGSCIVIGVDQLIRAHACDRNY